MKHAISQLQFDEGTPVSEENWISDFATSVALQIESNSDLTIHIYEANLEKGILSAEAILTFENPIGTKSSITTGKRIIILEKYIWKRKE